MYHRFFQFVCEPFGVSPDPRFFCSTSQHVEAASSLHYAIRERRGFAALIAAPGLGKTTVVASLLERLRAQADVVFLVHPRLDGDMLLESVLTGLGVAPDEDAARRTQQLVRRLSSTDSLGRTCVVILDEAQNLSGEALETVRMLSNFEAPDRKLIQFVLVGQPSLERLLKKPEYEQIRQRIAIYARLQPLRVAEVTTYITHRLRVAGCARSPFTPEATLMIALASGGVPRVINMLCFNSLTLAFADSTRVVTDHLVAEAIADLSLDCPTETLHPAHAAPALPQLEKNETAPADLIEPEAPYPAPTFALSSLPQARAGVIATLVVIAFVIAGFAIYSALTTSHRAQLSSPSSLAGGNRS